MEVAVFESEWVCVRIGSLYSLVDSSIRVNGLMMCYEEFISEPFVR